MGELFTIPEWIEKRKKEYQTLCAYWRVYENNLISFEDKHRFVTDKLPKLVGTFNKVELDWRVG